MGGSTNSCSALSTWSVVVCSAASHLAAFYCGVWLENFAVFGKNGGINFAVFGKMLIFAVVSISYSEI